MIREHFPRCHEMPKEIKEQYTELKMMTKKGEIESKSHWIDSAKAIGMIDTEKGIFFMRPMTLTDPNFYNDDEDSEEEEERNVNDEVNQKINDGGRIDGTASISSSTQTIKEETLPEEKYESI